MSMVVNTNIQAMNSHRSLKVVSEKTALASEKLSSGMRINRAGDDAAGLAISEKMRSQIKGLNRASTNAQDGISAIKTAEGALQETHEMLKRMAELTTQAANDTLTTSDRKKIQEELDQLIEEIDVIATRTHFNTRKLLCGDYASDGLWLQVGANSMEGIKVKIGSMTLTGLFGSISMGTEYFTADQLTALKAITGGDGAVATANISVLKGSARIAATKMLLNVVGSGAIIGTDGKWDYSKAVEKSGSRISKQIDIINNAIDIVSAERARLGAVQNRLEHTVKNVDIAAENLSSAESRIRDTDMAKEMMEFTQGNVLTQAAQSMLAQANQAPQQVLTLLQ